MSETRKDRGKGNGLQELTNALSGMPPLSTDWTFATPTQKFNRYYLKNG